MRLSQVLRLQIVTYRHDGCAVVVQERDDGLLDVEILSQSDSPVDNVEALPKDKLFDWLHDRQDY